MYFITAMTEPTEGKLGWPDYSSRCFGYYETFEEADQRVRQNAMDIHECLYDLAVIEKIDPGIHSIPDNGIWYKYVGNDTWEPTEKPALLKQFINMARVG